MTVQFECETFVHAPIERVFDLSLAIDAHETSMSRFRERAVAGVTSGRISLGEEVTWRAIHFGLPFTMTSRITIFERPHQFMDQQVRGPFRSFHHEHVFQAVGTGTVMTDRLCFAAPLGPLGRVAEEAVLDRYVRRLIQLRSNHLKDTAEKGYPRPDTGQ